MKFADPTESALIFRSLTTDFEANQPELRIDITGCLDRSASLARLVTTMLGKNQPSFFWIREFGIWPSLENWNLFRSLRAATGESRALHEAPGHEFASDELDQLVSYVQVTLLNGWGGVLVGRHHRQRIAISHDSWLSVRASAELPSQAKLVSEFGLPHRMEQQPSSLVLYEV